MSTVPPPLPGWASKVSILLRFWPWGLLYGINGGPGSQEGPKLSHNRNPNRFKCVGFYEGFLLFREIHTYIFQALGHSPLHPNRFKCVVLYEGFLLRSRAMLVMLSRPCLWSFCLGPPSFFCDRRIRKGCHRGHWASELLTFSASQFLNFAGLQNRRGTPYGVRLLGRRCTWPASFWALLPFFAGSANSSF